VQRCLIFSLNITLSLALALSPGPVFAAGARAAEGSRLQAIPADGGTTETRVYIVQFRAPAAVQETTLQADVAAPRGGQSRTAQARKAGAESRGNRRHHFDVGTPAVRQYADRLTEKHDAVLASVDAGNDKLYSYRYALNGFAARLTPDQARRLRARKDIRNVWEDRPKFVETNDSPAFLGLTAENGGLRRELHRTVRVGPPDRPLTRIRRIEGRA